MQAGVVTSFNNKYTCHKIRPSCKAKLLITLGLFGLSPLKLITLNCSSGISITISGPKGIREALFFVIVQLNWCEGHEILQLCFVSQPRMSILDVCE